MGPIRWYSYSGSGGTKGVKFVQCIDGQEPQMHEIWCLDSNGITRKVHLTAQIDVGDETVGHFSTHYFAENGRIIPIIGQISVNRSVKILGIPADAWECGLPFLENVLATTVPHGWGETIPPIINGPVSREDLLTMSLSHGVVPSLPVLLTYPGVRRMCALLRAAARHVYDDSLCSRL